MYKIRLKGQQIYAKGIAENTARNVKQVAEQSNRNYKAVLRWLTNPDMATLDLDMFADILVDGIGMSPDQIENARFGDFFEIIPLTE